MTRRTLRVRLSFWATRGRIERWFDETKVFFVLSIGRSGTKFLAHLLDSSSEAYVPHEPVAEDFPALQRAVEVPGTARDYIERFRKKEIYLRARTYGRSIYGEVNSALRRHCDALREECGNPELIHLVRDGRSVVRSMMARDTMTPRDPNTKRMYPRPSDAYYHEWPRLSRFERLCWYWQEENRFLRARIDRHVRFEDLITEYEYFTDRLCRSVGVTISWATWKATVDIPRHATVNHKIPRWNEWSSDRYEAFLRICGQEMEEYGYEP